MQMLSLWRGPITPPPKSMAAIAAEIAQAHGLTLAQLCASDRRARIVHPRQAAMAAMREVRWSDGRRRYSFPQIARFFGLKDHTTVVYGVKAAALRRAAP